MIHPAIDPLAEKNREMEPGEIAEILTRLGIRPECRGTPLEALLDAPSR